MQGFKEGDIVVIRQWDDMAKEYGLDGDGDIEVHCWFTKDMKRLCGMKCELKGFTEDIIMKGKYFAEVEPLDGTELELGDTISLDMLESACLRTEALMKHKLSTGYE